MAEKSILEKLKEVFKHSLVYVLGSVSQTAVGFILVPLYTKYFTTGEYGAFTLIQMCGAIAAALFYLGASSALPRSYYDYSASDERLAVFNTTLLLLSIGAILEVLFGLLLSGSISIYLFKSTEYTYYICITVISSAVGFMNQGFFVYLRLRRESKLVVVVSIISLISTVVTVYILLQTYHLGLGAPIWTGLFVQVALLMFFLVYFKGIISFSKIIPKEISIQLKFGIPSVFASLGQMLFEWTDKILINKYLSLGDVGVYSLGFKIASVANILIIMPFAMIWNPMMMEYRHDPNTKELFTRTTFYYSVVALFSILIAFLFINDIFAILIRGHDFVKSGAIVPQIMIGVFFYGSVTILSAGIFYARKPIYLTYAYFVWGLISIILNIYLIPKFSYWGAVWSGIFVRMGIAATIYYLSKRFFKFRLNGFRHFKLLFVLTLSIIALSFFPDSLTSFETILLKIGLLCLVCISVYFLILDDKEKNHLAIFMRRVGLGTE